MIGEASRTPPKRYIFLLTKMSAVPSAVNSAAEAEYVYVRRLNRSMKSSM